MCPQIVKDPFVDRQIRARLGNKACGGEESGSSPTGLLLDTAAEPGLAESFGLAHGQKRRPFRGGGCGPLCLQEQEKREILRGPQL